MGEIQENPTSDNEKLPDFNFENFVDNYFFYERECADTESIRRIYSRFREHTVNCNAHDLMQINDTYVVKCTVDRKLIHSFFDKRHKNVQSKIDEVAALELLFEKNRGKSVWMSLGSVKIKDHGITIDDRKELHTAKRIVRLLHSLSRENINLAKLEREAVYEPSTKVPDSCSGLVKKVFDAYRPLIHDARTRVNLVDILSRSGVYEVPVDDITTFSLKECMYRLSRNMAEWCKSRFFISIKGFSSALENSYQYLEIGQRRCFSDSLFSDANACIFGPRGSHKEAALLYELDDSTCFLPISVMVNTSARSITNGMDFKPYNGIGGAILVFAEEESPKKNGRFLVVDGVVGSKMLRRLTREGEQWEEQLYQGLLKLASRWFVDSIFVNVNHGEGEQIALEFVDYCKRKNPDSKITERYLQKPPMYPDVIEKIKRDSSWNGEHFLHSWYKSCGSPWNKGQGMVEGLEIKISDELIAQAYEEKMKWQDISKYVHFRELGRWKDRLYFLE